MKSSEVCSLLNDLIAIHARSLPVYLSDAAPWMTHRDAHAKDVVDLIAADQLMTVDQLAEIVIDKGGTVDQGIFPMDFTGLHDLSLDYLLVQMVHRQREDVERIADVVERLTEDAGAKAVAEEALGAAKGHLASLEELTNDVSLTN